MKRLLIFGLALLALCAGLIAALPANAGFIDFENGWDGGKIFSTITGLQFTNTAGYDWLYGDWRTNDYNGSYPNGAVTDLYPIPTQFFSNGNFFAWLGTDQGNGVISFTQSYATYFELGYSVSSGITLTAYDELGTVLDQEVGIYDNLGTGRLDTLRVEAPGMAYVMVSGTGNNWLIDDISTDAIQECVIDEHCDDHDWCTGAETCVNYHCVEGEAPLCEDDGLFCNGEESCSFKDQDCAHSGNPCAEGTICDEATKSCLSEEDEDDTPDLTDDDDESDLDPNIGTEEEEEGAGWPEGQVTGGCCGS
ncbi:hypothetical protein K8I61_20490 [bacterium]|nr:hypothetical protein [bacterium]